MTKNDQRINNPWTNMILRTSRNKLSRYHGTYIHTNIHSLFEKNAIKQQLEILNCMLSLCLQYIRNIQ